MTEEDMRKLAITTSQNATEEDMALVNSASAFQQVTNSESSSAAGNSSGAHAFFLFGRITLELAFWG